MGQIGRLILKTPKDQLVTDMENAALKIQKLYRGRACRKDMEDNPVDKTASASLRDQQQKKKRATKVGESLPPMEGESSGALQQNTEKMVALFSQMDASEDGMLSTEEFVNGIKRVPGIDKIVLSNGEKLDHENLLRMARAIDVSGNGTINYLEFLQAFSADAEGKSDIADTLGEDITTVLFRHRHAIRMGCHYLDEEGCGKIRAEEFQTVLMGVNTALSRPERTLTKTQIELLVEAMSQECAKASKASGLLETEAMVDYEFFLRSFVILDVQHNRKVVKKFV